MSGRAFLDTNVLVYAVDEGQPDKRQIARALIADRRDDLVLSAQVLNEFYVTTTRKLKHPLTPARAASVVRELAELPCVAIDADLVGAALQAGLRWQISHWDALVIEAARRAGCYEVLTEDLAAGASYDGLAVVNPFLDQK